MTRGGVRMWAEAMLGAWALLLVVPDGAQAWGPAGHALVTRAALAPEAGQAYVGANIRLGETTEVRAIVEQSDGTLLQAKREVKVTVGGCGG